MDRRDILKTSSVILGYSLMGGSALGLLQGCKADTSSDWKPITLTNDQANLLAELCETILPATDTPGAKDALCHRYIDALLTNFYSKEEQNKILTELKIFDDKSKIKFSKAFVALTPKERESVLSLIVDEMIKSKEQMPKGQSGDKKHIFTLIKENTISGYFTSEVGAKGGLGAFMPIPGPYKGCIDYSTIGKVFVL